MTDNLNNDNFNNDIDTEQNLDYSKTDTPTDLQDFSKTDTPEDLYDFTENEVHSYVKLSDKYNDIISSAATMMIVGIIGILFIILVLAKIIPLPLNPETSWLFYSVMGGIFIIFTISGIVSFLHAKQVKIDADAEDQLIDAILSWADDTLTAEYLNQGLDLTQPDELLYFGRADKIKDALMHQFEEADEALIYELTEQIYQKVFENNETNDAQ